MATNKTDEFFTYRVRPEGDRFFVGAKFDQNGQEVEVVTAKYVTEPDAEKELRSIVSGADVIASDKLNSVDAEDNKNVVLETTDEEVATRAGAAVRYVPTPAPADADNDFRPTDATAMTPAQKAVEAGTVSAVAGEDATPTPAEQKAIDAAAKKAEKEDA